jgi:hypothetical protein
MNMRVNSISDDMWMKLESVLVPYLDNIPMRPRKNQCTIRNTAELREIIKDRMRDLDIDGKRLSDMLGYDSSHRFSVCLAANLSFSLKSGGNTEHAGNIAGRLSHDGKGAFDASKPGLFQNGYVLSIPCRGFPRKTRQTD